MLPMRSRPFGKALIGVEAPHTGIERTFDLMKETR